MWSLNGLDTDLLRFFDNTIIQTELHSQQNLEQPKSPRGKAELQGLGQNKYYRH